MFFPREGKFKYEFQKGKPWAHEDLIADFDFPIYKSDEELNEEKEAIIQGQAIYFFDSPKIVEEAYQEYEKVFEQEWNLFLANAEINTQEAQKRRNAIYALGKSILDQIYEAGLIELHASHRRESRG